MFQNPQNGALTTPERRNSLSEEQPSSSLEPQSSADSADPLPESLSSFPESFDPMPSSSSDRLETATIEEAVVLADKLEKAILKEEEKEDRDYKGSNEVEEDNNDVFISLEELKQSREIHEEEITAFEDLKQEKGRREVKASYFL